MPGKSASHDDRTLTSGGQGLHCIRAGKRARTGPMMRRRHRLDCRLRLVGDRRGLVQPPHARRRAVAADRRQRQGFLGDGRRLLGTGRLLSIRQPDLQRDGVSARHPGAAEDPQPGRLRRRRPGPEFHLHRRAQAPDGVHHRHPPAEHAAAPDVQGAGGAVGRPRGLSLSRCLRGRGRPGFGPESTRAGPVRRVRGGDRQTRSSRSSTCGRCSITWSAPTGSR